jgi:hypothetical protein
LRDLSVALGGEVLLESAVDEKVSAAGTLKESQIHGVVQKVNVSQWRAAPPSEQGPHDRVADDVLAPKGKHEQRGH